MISILVPAHNEENRLKPAISNIFKAAKLVGNIRLDIIIVNDASTDKTAEIIKELEKKYPTVIRSIHHIVNQGIGAGLKEAVAIAKYPRFMTIPGDNDASSDLIKKLFIHRNKAELLLSYYINKEARTRSRNFVSTIYGLIYMCVFDVYIQYINGPCMYSTKRLRQLNIKSTRFSITAEIAIKMLRSGCTLYEIAGKMQTGLEGSTSLSLPNLLETMSTFIRLVYEIDYEKRDTFKYRPIRIYDGV